MSFELRSRNHDVTFDVTSFKELFDLVLSLGWQPAGAIPIDEYEFFDRAGSVGEHQAMLECVNAAGSGDGNNVEEEAYLTNDPKIIRPGDAKSLATFLRQVDDLASEKDKRKLGKFIARLRTGRFWSSNNEEGTRDVVAN